MFKRYAAHKFEVRVLALVSGLDPGSLPLLRQYSDMGRYGILDFHLVRSSTIVY